jgi:GH24 family phage-related lysozyme (muramidase)
MRGPGDEFLKWNRGNGRVMPGLTKRRAAERATLSIVAGESTCLLI